MRHPHVQEHEVWAQGASHGNGSRAISGYADDRVAKRLEILLETERSNTFILAYEDAQASGWHQGLRGGEFAGLR
jgi:hypothetical protein